MVKIFRNNRIGRYLIEKCFDEETANLLNYVTLSISDKEIQKELSIHKGRQLERIAWPVTIVLVISYVTNLYSVYFRDTGHPIWTITGGIDMV
jgi:hypothetical protein